jgi:hypothetical protein
MASTAAAVGRGSASAAAAIGRSIRENGKLSKCVVHGRPLYLIDLSHDTPPQAAKQAAKFRLFIILKQSLAG